MKLNIRGPCNTFLGYGHACFNIMKSLHNIGVDISYFPIGQPRITTSDVELLQQWIDGQNTFDYNAPSLTIWHENHLAERIGKGKNYALSFFELDTLNDRRQHHLNSVNHIIVPSSWGSVVLKNNNVKTPISVIPMGIDTTVFYPQHKQNNDQQKPYVFLVIGKWEVRKGHDILPQIFNTVFTPSDNVELWMMCDNPFLTQDEIQEWKNYYTQTPLGNKIKFINQVNTDQELANIINQADCGISLSRAEGFDLPLLQMMACGKHVITTNYSAHTEFCNNDNSFLIDIPETEEAYDGKWFGGQSDNRGNWAKLANKQIDQCVDYMKNVYYNYNNQTNTSGINTAQNMTWGTCGKKIIDLMFKVPPKPPPVEIRKTGNIK
jgi:glycosyltransferase involved in cell wall biosynthesis